MCFSLNGGSFSFHVFEESFSFFLFFFLL
uniref:Uncharacterized protein n=1 Tax=Rhizophora mucronata TaxID=61149 RepID=A0A2P2PNU1_RHIMU